ncbi:MAG: response regulator [Candidatus Thermoplasmatota archaeon]|nr:response regulator [Candidatus Thermoplasmatota archaeon]
MDKKMMEYEEKVYDILVVDDEPEVLDALENTLKRAGFFKCNIKKANGPKEAMSLLSKNKYHLVVSDYKMPEMDGIKFLTWVHENHPETAKIMLTGYGDLQVAKDAINKAHVDNFEEKPWDNYRLRSTIHQALHRNTEMKMEGMKEVLDVSAAMKIIEELEKNAENSGGVEPQRSIIALDSPGEFNKFSFELRKRKNVSIRDVQIMVNKYVVFVTVYPSSIERIS